MHFPVLLAQYNNMLFIWFGGKNKSLINFMIRNIHNFQIRFRLSTKGLEAIKFRQIAAMHHLTIYLITLQ